MTQFFTIHLLLRVIFLPVGSNVQRLHSSRCCAFSLSFPYPSSIIQSMNFCLGLSLSLFPFTHPSIHYLPLQRVATSECVISSAIYQSHIKKLPLANVSTKSSIPAIPAFMNIHVGVYVCKHNDVLRHIGVQACTRNVIRLHVCRDTAAADFKH